VKKSIA